jgi:hypothetical protein
MHATTRPFATAGLALVTTSLIAVAPMAPPPDDHILSATVRLLDTADPLGDLGNLGGLTNDLGNLVNIGGFANDLAGLNLGGLENVPYNLFADIVNIPYNEIQALGVYAEALGPAGGNEFVMNPLTGALTQLPFNTPVPAGDIPLGIAGTGSWWMESLGNTWGWDDGNFPQVDGLLNMLLPFPQFTTPLAEEAQILAEAEIVDGAKVGCEFECSDLLGYLGNWFQVPLTQLLSGYTFGNVLEDTIGATSSTGVVNLGPPPFSLPGSGDTIWSGTSATLNPLLPFESLVANLTGSPASNPIELPNLGTFVSNLLSLNTDISADFNPLETGSYLYWGAPTAYGLPSILGGIVQSLTGIPNQFLLPNNGAEPLSGYTADPSSLLTGLPQGFQYLVNGLLGYLNPETYITALDNLFQGNLPTALGDIPFLGFLGLGDPSALLGSLDPATLLGSFDPAALLGSLGPDLAASLGSLLPNAGADLAAMLGPELGINLGTMIPQLLMALIP